MQMRGLGGHDAVDAAVQRPPDAAADGDDVGHRERARHVLQDAGTRSAAPAPNASICRLIPATQRLDQGPGRRVHRVGLARGDRGDADGAMGDVARQVGGPEHCGLPPQRAAAQPVHLPQPVLRHGDAEAEKQVRRSPGIDVRHAGAVADDLDGCRARRRRSADRSVRPVWSRKPARAASKSSWVIPAARQTSAASPLRMAASRLASSIVMQRSLAQPGAPHRGIVRHPGMAGCRWRDVDAGWHPPRIGA